MRKPAECSGAVTSSRSPPLLAASNWDVRGVPAAMNPTPNTTTNCSHTPVRTPVCATLNPQPCSPVRRPHALSTASKSPKTALRRPSGSEWANGLPAASPTKTCQEHLMARSSMSSCSGVGRLCSALQLLTGALHPLLYSRADILQSKRIRPCQDTKPGKLHPAQPA